MASRVFNLLIVDDDPLVHQSLKLCIPAHWKAFSAQKEELVPYERFYHAAFIDMHLTADLQVAAGPRVIEKLLTQHPHTEVVAMSGDLSRELMESCLKAGAQKFLAKPLHPEEITMMLEKTEALWALRNAESSSETHRMRWVGESAASNKIKKRIAELRGESQTVLIEGETGTGKEVVARLLHDQENERPFIAVNIASIPENLFESELFGHVKGAFTGADQNKIGLIEASNGGDLFLDEIEAMPLNQQVKLLRFLESGEIRKVGSKENMIVRTRVIVASNRNLANMVESGEFREDLYFRLSSQRIQLPALRDRKEDIAMLAQFFLDSERPKRNKKFTEDGLQALGKYVWPGNVRELKRVCEQLSLTSPLPLIRAEDVEKWIQPQMTKTAAAANYQSLDLAKGLGLLVEEFEAHAIRTCLKQTKDIESAAILLKVSRSNLYKKIKDYQIETEEQGT